MNKTKIEWVRNPDGTQGYTWNVITGCLNHVNGLCKGGDFPCYAYKLANGRLKERYLANKNIAPFVPTDTKKAKYLYDANPFYPRFWEKKLDEPFERKKPSGIFPCDMSDLFGMGVPKDWTIRTLDVIRQCPQHRFYLLTKQPQNLPTFSPFPENCWVGVTCTGKEEPGFLYPLVHLKAKVKFISFEPLLTSCVKDIERFSYGLESAGINWLIIGAQTNPYRPPEISWVRAIVEAGIKVFLKDNLKPLLVTYKDGGEYAPLWANGGYGTLRQEMPSL